MSEEKTAAQVGYETYVTIATQEHWIPAHGDPHPVWGDLQPMIQDAWGIIATAIIAHWEREHV
jgi:hypothetical protein